jgi:hypothetical protein
VVKAFTARGLTHVRDLATYFTVDAAPSRQQHENTRIEADGIVFGLGPAT